MIVPFADPNLRAPIAVALGAIAGALLRYYSTPWLNHIGYHSIASLQTHLPPPLTAWSATLFSPEFPYGTLIINISGCFLMGLLTASLAHLFEHLPALLLQPVELRLLLGTGFLGAYTTFSTYGLEVLLLAKGDRWVAAFFYLVSSVMGGVGAVTIGLWCGTQVGLWWVVAIIREK